MIAVSRSLGYLTGLSDCGLCPLANKVTDQISKVLPLKIAMLTADVQLIRDILGCTYTLPCSRAGSSDSFDSIGSFGRNQLQLTYLRLGEVTPPPFEISSTSRHCHRPNVFICSPRFSGVQDLVLPPCVGSEAASQRGGVPESSREVEVSREAQAKRVRYPHHLCDWEKGDSIPIQMQWMKDEL